MLNDLGQYFSNLSMSLCECVPACRWPHLDQMIVVLLAVFVSHSVRSIDHNDLARWFGGRGIDEHRHTDTQPLMVIMFAALTLRLPQHQFVWTFQRHHYPSRGNNNNNNNKNVIIYTVTIVKCIFGCVVN